MRIVRKLVDGESLVWEEEMLLVEMFHKLAGWHMSGQSPDHTLQPTALVNEAYMRLFRNAQLNGKSWNDRVHFLRAASAAMRSILADHARRKNCDKRRPPGMRIDLEKLVESFADNCGGNLVSFDESLAKLEKVDPRMVRVIELYFFGAQPVAEIAKVLDISERTVGRELNAAKLWLRRELGNGG